MNVAEFIDKWRRAELTERSASHEHFLDLCDLLDHPKPAEVDPKGELFTFEKGAAKRGGSDGWADVWKKGYFAWEYKGRHKDLQAAYLQLDEYRAALENPPLLVTCDMGRIVVHTNFTATKQEVHEILLEDLGEPRDLEILRAVFHAPHKLKPGATSEAITTEAARRAAEIAVGLRERGLDPLQVARFLDRVVFSLFAEDIGLLPEGLFTRVLEKSRRDPALFSRFAEQLFTAMAEGGYVGLEEIRHFNGHLFERATVLELTGEEIEGLYQVALLDWSAIDPSILGTLFERGLDPGKRSQLGAHYTSREDIETLVEPVVMKPLRREWREVQQLVSNLLTTARMSPTAKQREKGLPKDRGTVRRARKEAQMLLRRFHQKLAHVTVLDPACGSGNFLYVTLQKLKDLEKEVGVFALDNGFTPEVPLVGPWQLHGIEINPYAFELAQMTVWIGYLQWTRQHSTGTWGEPILRPMDTFECKDAILDLSDPDNPREPEWPRVDFIVGNPPFLGNRFMVGELGEDYCRALFRVYQKKLGGRPDLVAYWYERARREIEVGRAKRAGLLATQGIRGGTNRKVLQRIKETGDIFFAEADRPWILDGANVHVSMVGFDNGTETEKVLDGKTVADVHPNLTAGVDVTRSTRLTSNEDLAHQGAIKRGSFDPPESLTLDMLRAGGNPNGRPNSDVIFPYLNAAEVARRRQWLWIIDFVDRPAEIAARYAAPFEYLSARVRPERMKARQPEARESWWLHWRCRPQLTLAIERLSRILVTPRVAKHRLFLFVEPPAHLDNTLVAVVSEDMTMLGVLHSRIHEVWARAQGTQLRERESGFRYTPTTCFETFPFPEPTEEQREAIAQAARELDELRERWLNPPEWVKEEVLEFPGASDGPWSRYVHDPDDQGIGTVRYPRLVPRVQAAATKLAQRTLTNLYNQRPTWLDHAHQRLDEAVAAAYGWPVDLSDEQILERLLALNLERAAEGA